MRIPAPCASPATRKLRLAALCAQLGLAAAPALAQQPAVSIVPSVRLTETVTDNASLGHNASGTEWITQIYPSVRLNAQGGRVSGNLTVGVNSSMYANGSLPDSNQMLLNGMGKVTVWDNHAYVDLIGSISRQPTYAFTPLAGDTVTGATHMSEVRIFSINPTLKGRFANTGTLEARYSMTQTDSDSSALARSLTNVLSLTASDPYAWGRAGWSLNFRDSHTERDNQRSLDLQTTRFTGIINFDPQVTMRLIAGAESNNYASSAYRNSTIYGVGADWYPTQRTTLNGTIENRFFGTGYLFSANHRTGMLTLLGSFSKDASSTSQSVLGAVTLYDLLMLQYAAQYPDVAERSAFVQKLINANFTGLGGAVLGAQSVLSNGFYLDRRAQLGVTYTGVRNSVSLIGFQSQRDTLTETSFALTGTSTTNSSVSSTGATISGQHKLTAITSAHLSLTGVRSRADQSTVGGTGVVTGPLDSRTRMIMAGLSTSLTKKATASLNYRNNHGSGANSYTENALIGSVAIQF